jgi:hypothetical protein
MFDLKMSDQYFEQAALPLSIAVIIRFSLRDDTGIEVAWLPTKYKIELG